MVGLIHDATNAKQMHDRTVLPEGEYNVSITSSENKAAKSGNGSYIALQYKVFDGEHEGRVLFVNLNINNSSQEAVDIAYTELTSIQHATGKLTISDTIELHGVPFTITTKNKVNPQYGEQSEVIKYSPYSGGSVASQQAAPPNAPQGQQTAPPWQQGAQPAQPAQPVPQSAQPGQQFPQSNGPPPWAQK